MFLFIGTKKINQFLICPKYESWIEFLHGLFVSREGNSRIGSTRIRDGSKSRFSVLESKYIFGCGGRWSVPIGYSRRKEFPVESVSVPLSRFQTSCEERAVHRTDILRVIVLRGGPGKNINPAVA
jgi:hypothetical protein